MPIVYKEVKLYHGYRIDLLVEEKVVIEIKTVETLNPLYLCKNEVNCMNQRWIVGSKAGTEPLAGGELTQVNPALEVPKFGLIKNTKFVGNS